MSGISGKRRRRSKEQVKRLVAEFEASGLERREFRGRHGLALSILQRHLSLFQEALGIREGADGARKYVLDLSCDEGTNQIQIAWLRGTVWKADFPPGTGNAPTHYLGDRQKALRWISGDVFDMTNVIILNSREPLPAVTYKV